MLFTNYLRINFFLIFYLEIQIFYSYLRLLLIIKLFNYEKKF